MPLRVVAVADLHGRLPDLPEGDLLLLAGDLLPYENQEEWTLKELVPWMKSWPGETVTVAGNHDWFFESLGPEGVREMLPGHYLLDSGVDIGGLRVWGTPWGRNFPGWAFGADPGAQHERFSLIPEKTDILLSHAPPSGVLDSFDGDSYGSPALASRLQRVLPRVHVFGHIHERAGEHLEIGSTLFVNAGVVDGNGAPVRPQVFQVHPQGEVP